MKTLMMTAAAALLSVGAAHAADVVITIDTDGDSRVSVQEWQTYRTGTEGVFGAWDANTDGMLSADEYSAGIELQEDRDAFGAWDDHYAGWDSDGDGFLSADEYNTGLWGAFDADDDDFWSQDELKAWEEDKLRYDATRGGREVSK